MKKVLSIDPGKRSIAWAFFSETLREAGFVKNKAEPFESGLRPMLLTVAEEIPGTPDIVVVEVPRIYTTSRKKNPNDLIDVATIAGSCTVFGDVFFVHPYIWKGQTPKNITALRVLEQLNQEEVLVIKKYRKNDHVLDAVGIGLWYRSRYLGVDYE